MLTGPVEQGPRTGLRVPWSELGPGHFRSGYRSNHWQCLPWSLTHWGGVGAVAGGLMGGASGYYS